MGCGGGGGWVGGSSGWSRRDAGGRWMAGWGVVGDSASGGVGVRGAVYGRRVGWVVAGDEELHPSFILYARRLGPQGVLADVIAVVGDEDDHGAAGQLVLVERLQHLADLGVHEADVGEVAVPHLGDLLGGRADAVLVDA